MRKSEIKHKIEESIKGFNHEFSESIKIMESMIITELPEVLPSKELFELFMINVTRLNNLRTFYESWKVSQGIMANNNDSSKCPECGEKIQNVACLTHEEIYEIGHAGNCSYKQIIKEGCTIE